MRIHTIIALISFSACTSDGPAPTTPIRSAAELSTYLKTAHDSPLDRLDSDARQRFLDSLVFGEHELGGFEYRDLQALPADDVYQILHLFGAERTMSMVLHGDIPARFAPLLRKADGDYQNYWCQSPHNCVSNGGVICMSGC